MLLLGMGSSAPELFVTLKSHLGGQGDLALGNIIGSNIFNILAVGGILLLSPSSVSNKNSVLKNTTLLLGGTLLAGGLALDLSFSLIDGLILLSLFFLFLYQPQERTQPQKSEPKKYSLVLGMVLAGFALLFLGSHLTIEASLKLGEQFGISKRIIGLFMLSIGTSLPELAIGIVSIMKKSFDTALGSIIGSNAFNTFLILGIAGLIDHLKVNPLLLKIDFPFMLLCEGVLLLALFYFKKPPKILAGFFLLSYGLYCSFVLF